MTTTAAAPAVKPYTVIGFWDDSDTAIAVAVVSRAEEFYGCPNVSAGGSWARDVHAASPEEAATLATLQTQDEFDAQSDDEGAEESGEGDDEDSGKIFEFEHNDVTYDVDFGGESYTIYRQEGNANITDFYYNGDPEDHLSVEESAIKALELLNL